MFLQISRKETMFTSAARNLPCSCGIGNFFRLDLEIDRSSATAQPPLRYSIHWPGMKKKRIAVGPGTEEN